MAAKDGCALAQVAGCMSDPQLAVCQTHALHKSAGGTARSVNRT
jgi:hypothetical protein